jgi:alkylation response protein AidB-like acyl-CoA dehydrogenase
MLDFTFTEEQRDIRELAHDFAQKEIRPVTRDYDSDATWPQQPRSGRSNLSDMRISPHGSRRRRGVTMKA